MSKLLTNQISNYNDNGPVEVKDGINVASGKPLQVAGANGTSGDYLKSTGSSVAWTTFPSIPAAQVNTDWNATSGVAQILNKPTLATVATSGSYNDLLNTPTIPSAQIQSDWNQSSSAALDFIKNKPSLFDGQYTSLTGAPTVPATLNDLADVNIPSPSDNLYIKWDASSNRWIQGSDNAGLSNIVEDLTPQLGGSLDLNGNDITGGTSSTIEVSGDANKIKFLYQNLSDLPSASSWHGMFAHVHSEAAAYFAHGGQWVKLAKDSDIPTDTDTNTTYSISCVDGDNADEEKIRLTAGGDGSGTDDIVLEAGTGLSIARSGDKITFTNTVTDTDTVYANSDVDTHLNVSGASSGQILSWNGSDYAWVADQTGGGGSGATVTTDDSAPSSPSDGDLWWKSDEGRLKIYYQDTDSSQWVDANPPLPSTSISNGTTNGTNGISTTTSTSGSNANAIEIKTDNNSASAVRWRFTPPGHLIPSSNADYDIGNAEYKVRHLFLSDNTVYFQGDYLKVAQHNSGGSAESPSYLIPLSKLKDALNSSANYEAFKTAILAITDAT